MSVLQKNGVRGNGAGCLGAQRAVGERSEEASGAQAPVRLPDPELLERPVRRRFTSEYKLDVLRQAEACCKPGDVGALLRREGLYSSHLTTWRRQRDEGALESLSRPRGRRPAHPLEKEIAELRRCLVRTEADLATARRVIEVQGNVSALLGELLEPRGAKPDENTAG
jgi:transposase